MTGGTAVERGARREVQSTGVRVVCTGDGHRLDGDSPITVIANLFLGHLGSRGFSSSTVRAYAFDLLNFARFLAERGAVVGDVVPTDLFDYLDWQAKPIRERGAKVVRLADRHDARAHRNSSGVLIEFPHL